MLGSGDSSNLTILKKSHFADRHRGRKKHEGLCVDYRMNECREDVESYSLLKTMGHGSDKDCGFIFMIQSMRIIP